ncbi:hypothetical protein [Pacificibacter marinus]|nr:hypothetical protein [Pacificibacter marinus]
MVSYQTFMETVLEQRVGVSRYFSYIVTKSVKNTPPPFDSLLPN